jgi:hypothetical protein
MGRSGFSILFASIYLLVFIFLLHSKYETLVWVFFLFSPVVVIAMVYNVIRYGKYTGRELKEDEEWGYENW